MVQLTETETDAFWEEKEQIGLDADSIQGLLSEDTKSPIDLAQFKKE